MNIDKILVSHAWYLYDDSSYGTVLVQFCYKTYAWGQNFDTYTFKVFGHTIKYAWKVLPSYVVCSSDKLNQLRRVEINPIFLDLFK